MKRSFIFFAIVSVFLCLPSCVSTQSNVPTVTITEGIAGMVLWREGNFMPSIDDRRSKGMSKGISREIYIYKLTNESQATRSAEFFTDIKTDLVTKVVSKEDGSFEVSLPPGNYSIFTKEEGGFFANIMDGESNIYPVTVDPARVTTLTIIVDYKASY